MKESYDTILELQLVSVYQILVRSSLEITNFSSDVEDLRHWFLILTERWADAEFRMVGEFKDVTNEKQKVISEFEKLVAARRSKTIPHKEASGLCFMCGAALSKAYYADEFVCTNCAQPVIDALGNLVRASTNRFSPDELLRIWKSW